MKNSLAKTKFKTLRKICSVLCVLVLLCPLLTAFPHRSIRASAHGTHAPLTPFEEFSTSINIENGNFSTTAVSYPAGVSGWTGQYLAAETGNVISGIVRLNADYVGSEDDVKLNKYPEYKNNAIPQSPFGISSQPNTDKDALVINTNGTRTAYGYTSAQLTLEADSFYEFTVWCKTGSFAASTGAAITVIGLEETIGFWNIDTVTGLATDSNNLPILNEANDYGWVEFKIFLATGPVSESVNLQLSVGDAAEDHNYPSKGYAFFDTVTLFKHSPTNFYWQTASVNDRPNVLIHDLTAPLSDLLKADSGEVIGDFSTAKNWTRVVEEDIPAEFVDYGTLAAAKTFPNNLIYGLEIDPFTPTGKAFPDKNIMVISSYDYDKDSFNSAQGGIKSPSFTIAQNKYYILTFWYSTQLMEAGGAGVILTGENTNFATEYKLERQIFSGLTTDNNQHRYGWQNNSFLIRGSVLKDVKLNLELWLGWNEPAQGIAMFSDITLSPITYAEFLENRLTSTKVEIDYSASSGITNGDFYDVQADEDDNISYPAAPNAWMFLDTQTAATTNHSTRLVDIDDAVYGAVPVDRERYAEHRSEFLNIANPLAFAEYPGQNMLLMASPSLTAFGYKSDALSLPASTQQKLTVTMRAEIEGYGACLILKKGNTIVNTIEGIKSTGNGFADYVFYLEGGEEDTTLSLEIWMGMTDRESNYSKLSSGYMFVKMVALNDFVEGFSELSQRFEESATPPRTYSVYRANSLEFFAHDRYSSGIIKEAYEMTLAPQTQNNVAGVVGTLTAGQSEVPEYFMPAYKQSSVYNAGGNVLLLQNSVPLYSKFSADNKIRLHAGDYYKIEFTVLVDLGGAGFYQNGERVDGESNHGEYAIGAGIHFGSFSFKNIRDTLTSGVIDYNSSGEVLRRDYTFKTFTFYYATGLEEENVEWAITLGGNKYDDESIAGRIFVASLAVNHIDIDVFESEVEELDDEDEEILSSFIVIDKSGESGEDPSGTTSGGNRSELWYIIPSALFAIAVIMAVVAVVVKKAFSKVPKNILRSRVVSYDRKRVSGAENHLPIDSDIFESFDDDKSITDDTSASAAAPSNKSKPESAPLHEQVETPLNEFDD